MRRALLSVYDKTGLEELARGLHEAGVALVSTGSTAARIAAAGVPVTAGRGAHRLPRVPRRPGQDAAPAGARRHPRRPAAGRPRAAARRARHRAVRPGRGQPLPVPRDRGVRRRARRVRRADRHRRPVDGAGRGEEPPAASPWSSTPRRTPTCWPRCRRAASTWRPRRRLAAQAFAHTAAYDTAVASWCAAGAGRGRRRGGRPTPGWRWSAPAVLRYGENPHQQAALYVDPAAAPGHRPGHRSCTARRCRYNNYVDADAALRAAFDFDRARASRSSSTPTRAASRSAPTSPTAHARGARLRPGVRVRRRDRGQPPGHPGDGRAGGRGLHRGGRRAGVRRGRARDAQPRRRTCGCSSCPTGTGATPSSCARCRGGVLVQTADRVDADGDDPPTWTLAAGEPADDADAAPTSRSPGGPAAR